jgi:hypothetical protein
MVHPLGPWGSIACGQNASVPGSGTWPTTDLGFYHPVYVPTTCTARRVWWANGATVNASYNVDVGIYADNGRRPGALIVSAGSTAQGTANQVQFVDVTDTTLAPGLYWIAVACSSTSATIFRINPGLARAPGLYFTEASAVPLPATATPVEPSALSGYVHLFGFATTAAP